MDINEQDQPDMDFEDTRSEQSVHSDSPDSSDTFGESELLPRVGDEYQVAIPPLLTPSERLKYFSNPCDSQPLADASHNFLIGLPIPIKFAYNETKSIKDEGTGLHNDVDCSKMEPNECVTECSSVSDKRETSVLPGLRGDSWSEFEDECFLLGLYLFGKNLVQVKRFMEGKEMGQMLAFYYGRFYRSAKYQRWADCRKTKGRKCIIGQRILTGSRQQELLSRLLPHLSDVSRNTAVEAYKAFMDGRNSLEEYVCTLKSMVGIRALVEAVRIGKENEDLSVMAMESSRNNHTFTSRPEMLSAKACSSLTYEEIVKYLTGDYRLSKARSSDLFWEAVWPRLLAKGWHSEKPRDEAYRGFKNPLVFLLPGVKKFRRKLFKGYHYFDSVSDVLKRVASEPELLVLESEENGATTFVKGNGSGSEPNSDKDGGSDFEHHRYLKPRSSSDAANHMKFTIVDTSLIHEDELSKVREMRSLPAEMKTSLSWARGPREATYCSDRLKDLVIFNHSKGQSSHCDNVSKYVKRNADHALKRRRLTACSKKEKKPVIRSYPEYVLSLPAHSKKAVRRSHSNVRAHKKVSPTSSLVADNHGEKICKGDPEQGSCSLASSSEIDHQAQPLIDLNVPQVSAEPKANEQVTNVKVEEGNVVLSQNGGNDTNPHLESAEQDEQANGNARRQSTRIRPLSTRALEALESSFFNPKVGKKRPQAVDLQDEKPKVSRRARSKSSVHAGNCTVDAVRNSESMRSDQIHNAASDVLHDTLT